MTASSRPDHRALAEALRRRVLDGSSLTDRPVRRAAAERAAGGLVIEAPYDDLARQIGESAGVTDEQVASVLRAAGSEKALPVASQRLLSSIVLEIIPRQIRIIGRQGFDVRLVQDRSQHRFGENRSRAKSMLHDVDGGASPLNDKGIGIDEFCRCANVDNRRNW